MTSSQQPTPSPTDLQRPSETAGAAIAELRLTTGLTWEQLAALLGSSRRSLHCWASGESLNRESEEHLRRVLSVVRAVDRGSVDATRAALFAAGGDDGRAPFDLLVDKQYGRVAEMLGPGSGRKRPPIAFAVLSARAPQGPGQLVGALHDRAHATSGRLLGATEVRTKRTK